MLNLKVPIENKEEEQKQEYKEQISTINVDSVFVDTLIEINKVVNTPKLRVWEQLLLYTYGRIGAVLYLINLLYSFIFWGVWHGIANMILPYALLWDSIQKLGHIK